MSNEIKGALRVVQLYSSNFQRITAVHIVPKGDLIQITGKNDQGKTSVLDSIWAALDNTMVGSQMPIRKGTNKAHIKLDLGEIIVERKFTPSGPTLTVQSADGAQYKSPQKLLDGLLGALSFDPLDFARMKPREQYDLLRKIVKLDVDLDDLKAKNEGDYGRRTEVNREVKYLEAQIAAIVIPPVVLPPERPVVSDLLDEIQMAIDGNAMLAKRRAERNAKNGDIGRLVEASKTATGQAEELRKEAAELLAEADAQDKRAAQLALQANELEQALDTAPPIPEDANTSTMRAQVDDAERVCKLFDQREAKARLEKELYEKQARAAELTEIIEGRDHVAAKAIEGAAMPVPGISFGDGIVMFNEVPFSQASTAVKLKTSLAIAMQANPTIRVIRIQNGNDLDADNMKVVEEMAAEHEYQVWLERVNDDGNIGVVIEDGAVKSTPESRAQSAT